MKVIRGPKVNRGQRAVCMYDVCTEKLRKTYAKHTAHFAVQAGLTPRSQQVAGQGAGLALLAGPKLVLHGF